MNVLKRRRTELACVSCRRKKAKCDGGHPSCLTCLNEKSTCRYEANIASNTSRKGSASRSLLEERVAQLERELAASRSNNVTRSPPLVIAEAASISSARVEDDVRVGYGQQPADPVELSDEEAAVDTLATTAFSHEPEISIGHFGPSSNHGYFRALSNVFAHLPEDGRAADPKNLHRWSRYRPASEHDWAQELARSELCDPSIMPDANTAMFLFNQFFICMSLSSPYISRFNVLRHYDDAQGDVPRAIGAVRRALFNILWAHGATAAGRSDAELFYRRAMRCLNSLTIREAGDELVQLLLLVCAFQQDHQRSVASWTFHALAVKAAFQMGLHAPATYEGLSADHYQLRVQLWLGVLNHDRFLATVLGRPCLIPSQYVRVNSRSLQSRPGTSMTPVSSSASKGMEFTMHVTSLYNIVAAIVEILYDHNMTAELLEIDELCSQRLKLSLRLEDWKSSLPAAWSLCGVSELQHTTTDGLGTLWPRALLAIHYYRAQHLVNRPVIIAALRSWIFETKATSQAVDEIAFTILKADLATARELVSLVRVITRSSNEVLLRHGMWFTANYSVFAACVHLFGILIACAKQQSLLTNLPIGLSDVRLNLQQALELLKAVGAKSLMSQKGAACLFTFLSVYDSFVSTEQGVNTLSNDHSGLMTVQAAGQQVGLLSDFIMQTTDDFFFGDLTDQYYQPNTYNILH